MSRGDYIDVTYRTGAGIATHRVRARGAGGSVAVTMPGRNELFVVVEEMNNSAKPEALVTARFLATEVLSIIEGNIGDAPAVKQTPRARKPKVVPND